jgi:hypothetical protein
MHMHEYATRRSHHAVGRVVERNAFGMGEYVTNTTGFTTHYLFFGRNSGATSETPVDECFYRYKLEND